MSKVSFSKVEIRCYPMILGDNPGVDNGVPITLSWEYSRPITVSLNLHEYLRQSNRNSMNPTRLSAEWRHDYVIDAGFTIKDIIQVKKEINYIKLSRKRVVRNFNKQKLSYRKRIRPIARLGIYSPAA